MSDGYYLITWQLQKRTRLGTLERMFWRGTNVRRKDYSPGRWMPIHVCQRPEANPWSWYRHAAHHFPTRRAAERNLPRARQDISLKYRDLWAYGNPLHGWIPQTVTDPLARPTDVGVVFIPQRRRRGR